MIHEPAPSSGPEALVDLLRRRVDALAPDAGPAAGLELLCRGLVAELGLRGATVTVMVEGGAQGGLQGGAAASDPAIELVDSVQFDVGEGPSRDAFTTGMPVLVPDLAATDGQWPGFKSETLARGIAAVYAFPLHLAGSRLGVLTGYADQARELGPEELAAFAAYAAVTASVVAEQGAGEEPDADPEAAPGADDVGTGFLHESVTIRTEVYQAQGMVTVDLDVGLDEALARMRAAAFAAGIPLDDLARDIVAGHRRLDPDPDPDPDPHHPANDDRPDA